MKQLLVYYYRVVYCEDGHFTRPGEDASQDEASGGGGGGGLESREHDMAGIGLRAVPKDVITPTIEQQRAMEAITGRGRDGSGSLGLVELTRFTYPIPFALIDRGAWVAPAYHCLDLNIFRQACSCRLLWRDGDPSSLPELCVEPPLALVILHRQATRSSQVI